MKSVRRILIFLGVLALVFVMIPAASALGLQIPEESGTVSIPFQVNPLYRQIYSEQDFDISEFPIEPDRGASTQAITYQTISKASNQMREYLKDRVEVFTVYVQSSSGDYNTIANQLVDKAMSHTGDPEAGDYLMWQYGGWSGQVSYQDAGNDTYQYAFTFSFSYYTTAEQEAELDTAINKVLKSLNVGSKSDYQKVCAVYDYICDNITYDYANLEDTTYKLKHTAYAAMIDKTAVCQGYALLFYRMALELDVDNRLIAGLTDDLMNHGWNIVELDGLYYNVDSTWDAGVSSYDYFLKNSWEFPGHYRFAEYETLAFHNQHPMAAESYDPNVKAQMDPYIYIGYCGDSAVFGMTRNGMLVIGGEGAIYDYYHRNQDDQSPWQLWNSDITDLYVLDGITRLGEGAFFNLSELTRVTLPDSLTEIGSNSFSFCTKLTRITIPSNVRKIENDSFYRSNLKNLYFTGDAPTFSSFALDSLTANIWYPTDNETYTDNVRQNYGGTITWNSYTPLKITQQPKSTSALYDKKAVVTVQAEGNDLTYQWYYANEGSDKFYLTTAFTGNTYYVKMNEERDNRRIYCVITDIHGNSVTTDTVTLNLLDITAQPADSQASLDKTVKTTVKATGDDLTYTWYIKDPGSSSFSKSSVTSATYSVKMTAAKSGRQVYCVITDRYGSTITTRTSVLSAAASITKQPSNASGLSGTVVKTSVTAFGTDLTYQWYICNPGSSTFSKSSVTSATYSCRMSGAIDGRKVYCIVTDGFGNTAKSNTVTLTMSEAVKITGQPADSQASLDKTVKTTVKATGDDLTYTWYIKDPGSSSFSKSSVTSATYSVKMTAAKSGRQVYCVITDRYGNTVTTRTAVLSAAASITKQPSNASGLSGTVVKTSVTAFGTDLTYQWYICNPGSNTFSKSSVTSATYSCRMSEAIDGRKVYCIVTDGFGNTVTSNTVTLTMK